jgi:Restriction endonuclease
MANYDFRGLSPHDFELLCRDLLQKLLGVHLESFTTGRDSGIDFRHRAGGDNLIVQCKHYAESGYDALARVLAGKERKKLDALKPTRYILATSVGLTPTRKEELLKVLAPYCLEPADLLGREDINNLLTQHNDVERQHFKLWLTSATVLERVLNAGIFSESDRHLERIRQRLCRYVPNPSLERAQQILQKSHFCIAFLGSAKRRLPRCCSLILSTVRDSPRSGSRMTSRSSVR